MSVKNVSKNHEKCMNIVICIMSVILLMLLLHRIYNCTSQPEILSYMTSVPSSVPSSACADGMILDSRSNTCSFNQDLQPFVCSTYIGGDGGDGYDPTLQLGDNKTITNKTVMCGYCGTSTSPGKCDATNKHYSIYTMDANPKYLGVITPNDLDGLQKKYNYDLHVIPNNNNQDALSAFKNAKSNVATYFLILWAPYSTTNTCDYNNGCIYTVNNSYANTKDHHYVHNSKAEYAYLKKKQT